MSIKMYVGNFSKIINECELELIFSKHGEVLDLKIVRDLDSGKSRGYGFVEMRYENDGIRAIKCLNDKQINGRKLVVIKENKRKEIRYREG